MQFTLEGTFDYSGLDLELRRNDDAHWLQQPMPEESATDDNDEDTFLAAVDQFRANTSTAPNTSNDNGDNTTKNNSEAMCSWTAPTVCIVVSLQEHSLQHSSDVAQLLMCLLPVHNVSPWITPSPSTKRPVTTTVLVQVENKTQLEKLVHFRTSNVCPDWYLYGNTSLLDDDDSLFLAVYRCLSTKRPKLHPVHPETKQAPPPQCLWGEEIDKETKTTIYRPVAPPLYRVDDDPSLSYLQQFLQHVDVFQQEAQQIGHWMAWPESVHYNTTNNSPTQGAPWHVFPLCHCFPAHDGQNLTWIAPTVQACPRTVQLLKDICGTDRLRTCLFSKLDADSTLEAHTGWADLANYVLRVHVPLFVPTEFCGVWVDGCVQRHHSNQLVVFDDSKIHRAYNYSPPDNNNDNNHRVVLIVDVARPPHWPCGTATGAHSEELDDFIARFSAPR